MWTIGSAMPYWTEKKFTCARIRGLLVVDADSCRTGLDSGKGLDLHCGHRFIYVQGIGRAYCKTSIVIEVSACMLSNCSPELLSIQYLF
jgi:hypothetical protein